MAFLNMEQHTWAFTFGILGNIISLMVFLSPLPTFYRVYRKKSTEGFQSTPYLVTLFSCLLWMYYAFLKSGSELLLTINAVGCVIESLYIAMYLVYAPKSARLLTAKLFIGLDVGLFGLIALVTMLASHGPLRVQVVGWICVAVALGVFAAPLSIIRLVIRTKSVEFMPFSLSFFLVLSAVIWFAYGALKKDIFVAMPNVLGFLFGVAQMALYMAYRNKKPATVAVIDTTPRQRQRCTMPVGRQTRRHKPFATEKNRGSTNDALKRGMTPSATDVKSKRWTRIFTPDPWHLEGTLNNAPKREATLVGAGVTGAGAQSFRSDPHKCHQRTHGCQPTPRREVIVGNMP
ncbi:Bidirectional sugar transporter SWEET15 [Triticum urartu]|uniref:Bidirectional sugar transporter SWEET15 n=1 Tax=Triticum urartu TaxID=4572 RepID=M7ZDM7_TRIUA|nr:Bidirectional sugar transporter SWEET15 [Triticum urartu]